MVKWWCGIDVELCHISMHVKKNEIWKFKSEFSSNWIWEEIRLRKEIYVPSDIIILTDKFNMCYIWNKRSTLYIYIVNPLHCTLLNLTYLVVFYVQFIHFILTIPCPFLIFGSMFLENQLYAASWFLCFSNNTLSCVACKSLFRELQRPSFFKQAKR